MTSSIRECYDQAQQCRAQYMHSGDHQMLDKAIAAFRLAHDLLDRAGMFSKNEILDDIVTSELRYFLNSYFLGQLITQRHTNSRKEDLTLANVYYRQFLHDCELYEVIPPEERSAVRNTLSEGSGSPDMVSTTPAEQRQKKIWRYKRDQSLQTTITKLSQEIIHDDDDELRVLQITIIHRAISSALQEIESCNKELLLLDQEQRRSMSIQQTDLRSRQEQDPDVWRLDTSTSEILGPGGKILRPFVITSKRQNIQGTIFRADHSLPTMSIEEYLEDERANGGILDSSETPKLEQSDALEDDYSWQESERRKANDWDDFRENNPKGIGNTMNRG